MPSSNLQAGRTISVLRSCLLPMQLPCHVKRLPGHLCFTQSTSRVAATEYWTPYAVATTKRRNPRVLNRGAYSPVSVLVIILLRQTAASQPCFVNPEVALCTSPVRQALSALLLLVADDASREVLEHSSPCMHRPSRVVFASNACRSVTCQSHENRA